MYFSVIKLWDSDEDECDLSAMCLTAENEHCTPINTAANKNLKRNATDTPLNTDKKRNYIKCILQFWATTIFETIYMSTFCSFIYCGQF